MPEKSEPLVKIIGLVALLTTLILIFVGLTSQIYLNYTNKNTAGLSLPFFILSFTTWCSWCAYGVVKKDYFIAIAQGTGAVMNAIILLQFYLYSGY